MKTKRKITKKKPKTSAAAARARPLRLEWIEAGSIKRNPDNWARHPERQAEAMRAALDQIGWAGAVVYNERTEKLIDGHLRLDVVDPATAVPVLVGSWSPAQERTLLLSINPIAGMSGADLEGLEKLLDGAKLEGGLQHVADDLRGLLEQADRLAATPDEALEPPKVPKTKMGDLWHLGDHRLLCGDATSECDVARLFDGARPMLAVTDPPYGVNYDAAWRDEAARRGYLDYAPRRTGKVTADDRIDWSDAWSLFPGDTIYCWSAPGGYLIVSGLALERSGFAIRSQIVWSKPHFPIGRGHYSYRHEPCWYAVRIGRPSRWVGDKKQCSVWEVPLDRNVEGGHSTQKPVELFARAIRNHEAKEIYDPFAGSGPAVIAAEALGRRCYAMDIDRGYCDVIVRRWEKMTGDKAKR